MFSGVDFNVVGFTPTEDKKDEVPGDKNFIDSSSQTEIKVKKVACQTRSPATTEVQTEEIVQTLPGDYNAAGLDSFLRRVYPELIQELDKIEKTKAFTLYQTSREDQFENRVHIAHTIQSESIPEIPKVRVSCVAWSCTENVVILGYESIEHSDWCTHNSSVEFYNIKMSDFQGGTPTYSVLTGSCVTALAAHPYEPAISAVGTAGGEVHIFNLQKGPFGADIGNSIFHEDKVTKLSWENINSQLYLVSSSLDSYMYFYKVNTSIGSVQLHERYLMTTEPSQLRAGILSFSFSSQQPGVFAVGLENGEIIHCSTFGAPSIPSSSARNPVLRVMSAGKALPVDIKFSPFLEHVFVALLSDNTLQGFSLKESAPLYHIFLQTEALGAGWSPRQADVFFIWGKSPKVFVHSGKDGASLAELESETQALVWIKSIAVCAKSPRLAVSGNDGKVMIWDIPPFFKVP